jgi:hypothetical protein
MEVSTQLHTPDALPPEKQPSVSIGQEAGQAPEPVWTLRKKEKSYPWWKSDPDRPVRTPLLYWAVPGPNVILWRKKKTKCKMLSSADSICISTVQSINFPKV